MTTLTRGAAGTGGLWVTRGAPSIGGRQDLVAVVVDRGPQPVGQRDAGAEFEEAFEPRGVAVPAWLPLGPAGVEDDTLPRAGEIDDPPRHLADGRLLVGPDVRRLGVARPLADPDQAVDEVADVEEGAALPAGAPDLEDLGGRVERLAHERRDHVGGGGVEGVTRAVGVVGPRHRHREAELARVRRGQEL